MFVVVAEIKTLAITQSLIFWTWMGCCRYAYAAYTCLILITWRLADIGVNCLATLCRFTAIRGIVIAVIEASLTLAVGILTEHVGAAGRVALSAMFIVSGEIRA